MILGAHTSIAGGLHLALERGVDLGCDMVQVFSKNQRQWRSKPLSEEVIEAWTAARRELPVGPVVCHDSYLINLGHPDDDPWQRSLAAFIDELERCQALSIELLVLHPGSSLGRLDEGQCCDRVAEALNRAFDATSDCQTVACIENTAGQGSSIGHRFWHLARIIAGVEATHRVATCFDTCHAFASGHDLRSEDGYRQTWEQYDREVGIHRLRVFHLNDARRHLGSRVDRHANIGLGELGEEPFRRLVNDPRFAHHPAALETPSEENGGHREDLNRLRALLP